MLREELLVQRWVLPQHSVASPRLDTLDDGLCLDDLLHIALPVVLCAQYRVLCLLRAIDD